MTWHPVPRQESDWVTAEEVERIMWTLDAPPSHLPRVLKNVAAGVAEAADGGADAAGDADGSVHHDEF